MLNASSSHFDPSATSSRNFCCDAQRCPLVGFVLDGQFCMRRRNFIALLGSAAVAWPLASRAQQPTTPVIGFLSSLSGPVTSKRIVSFGHGLSETGYAVGRDVTVETRMAEGQYDRLPALAADLVGRQVGLIAALAPQAAFAAKAATTTIPIVFVGGLRPETGPDEGEQFDTDASVDRRIFLMGPTRMFARCLQVLDPLCTVALAGASVLAACRSS